MYFGTPLETGHGLPGHVHQDVFISYLRTDGGQIFFCDRAESFRCSPKYIPISKPLVNPVSDLAIVILPDLVDPGDLAEIKTGWESSVQAVF